MLWFVISGLEEMNEQGEERTAFEIAVVVPKRVGKEDERRDCVDVLLTEFRKAGLTVETVGGLSDDFIKLGAPVQTLGRAAAELQIRKPTRIGMELRFQWDEVDAFVRQPDGSLFSWCERFHCYRHLLYGVVNKSDSAVTLRFDGKDIQWEAGECLLKKLETEGIVKDVFPLHDETKRKQLLRSWALNWRDLTTQPIDEIYAYFGTKIATYFAFLGMYTRWLLFPAALGLILHLVDFGSLWVLPVFFISIILWAVLFLQFWKRKNAALLTRWQVSYAVGADPGNKLLDMEWSPLKSPMDIIKKWGSDNKKLKEAFQRDEWLGHLLRFRNDAVIILSIICLQLPFELAYAHLYEITQPIILKYMLTAAYLLIIQYLTKTGGKFAVKLIKNESYESTEYKANSLIYKVFGLYFMQNYIGLFYNVLLHRDFSILRQILIQRLIVTQVLDNLIENSLPYLKYSYKKYRAVRSKQTGEKGSSTGKAKFNSRVEKEFLKLSYSASIGDEVEDGLFDEFLELALQFGMMMMFACAFPLAFAFAALHNVTEIRADALKLLATLKRPVPRAAATIGAWLNIFQFLIVMSICTNCALLVCLYDQERKWKIEPGLAAILVIEHLLLLMKFWLSRFVPEEPAWVRANRVKNAAHAQDMYSEQLLRSISGGDIGDPKAKKME